MKTKTLSEMRAEKLQKENREFAPVVARRGTSEGVCDIIVAIDLSASVENYVERIKDGIRNLAKALRENAKTRGICKISIISFSSGVKPVCERLSPSELEEEGISITAYGCTDGYEAIATVNSMVKDLRQLYNPASGLKIPHNRIRIFWISDGFYNDASILEAVTEYKQNMSQNYIQSYFVGLGECFNMDMANTLARAEDQLFGSYNEFNRAVAFISSSVIMASKKVGSDNDIHFSNDRECVLLNVTGD